MAKSKVDKEAKTGKAAQIGEHKVGRPLQARLIAVEIKIGLFSQERAFDADSRFNNPVILSNGASIPPGMNEVFAEELAEVRRLNIGETCHKAELKPYRIYCLPYFHYDGFRALLYVERNGALIAAWKEEEVAQPDSPRMVISGQSLEQVENFIDTVLTA